MQARGTQQRRFGDVLRIGRVGFQFDAEFAGGMLDRNRFGRAGGVLATPSQTEPFSTQAVATVTAASTPMASWQTCGMKLRVEIAPPARGGAISVILG